MDGANDRVGQTPNEPIAPTGGPPPSGSDFGVPQQDPNLGAGRDRVADRIEESKNWFERAAEKLPGYRGYKAKELRREADKIQRLYVAERLEACRRKLEEVELGLTQRHDLTLLSNLDTAARKLRKVRDRVQFGEYGYAGLFDTVKVDEPVLDELYRFDVGLQDQAKAMEDLCQALSPDSPSLSSDIAILDGRISDLDEYFTAREHLITGVGR
jgi:hypothetical protein